MIERMLRGKKALDRPYFRRFPPEIDWQWMLVIGIVLGALISSVLGGRFRTSWATEGWLDSFGNSIPHRLAMAVVGGMLLGFGARWAGGCTSGHGISGTLQLALSSWLATVCFFAAGILTAHAYYLLMGA